MLLATVRHVMTKVCPMLIPVAKTLIDHEYEGGAWRMASAREAERILDECIETKKTELAALEAKELTLRTKLDHMGSIEQAMREAEETASMPPPPKRAPRPAGLARSATAAAPPGDDMECASDGSESSKRKRDTV